MAYHPGIQTPLPSRGRWIWWVLSEAVSGTNSQIAHLKRCHLLKRWLWRHPHGTVKETACRLSIQLQLSSQGSQVWHQPVKLTPVQNWAWFYETCTRMASFSAVFSGFSCRNEEEWGGCIHKWKNHLQADHHATSSSDSLNTETHSGSFSRHDRTITMIRGC